MKVKINTAIIEKLNPCASRFENWKMHYLDFDADILKFLELDNITAADKIWVAVRILPRQLVETFAIDCAKRAKNYVAATYADAAAAYAATYADAAATYADAAAAYAATYADAAAAYAATYAANYAAAAAAYAANCAANYAAAADSAAAAAAYAAAAAERQNQVDALIMLINLTQEEM